MKKMMTGFLLLFSLSIILAENKQIIVDWNATSETKALFFNLKKVSESHTLVGHHDATIYGHTWKGDENRSDIKDVCGSHPALLGLDFAVFTNAWKESSAKLRELIIKRAVEAYERGAVLTFCWHSDNPLNGESAWVSKTQPVGNTVKELLPGGNAFQAYKDNLKKIAEAARLMKTASGVAVPIIFRPFHEMEGDWFWWGRKHRTGEEFKQMWKFTVEYLRDSLQVHNFLYAYSTDCQFNTREEYLLDYPGDNYVDLLGMDDYWDFRHDGSNNPELAAKKLKIMSDIAIEKGKLAAFTETGLESIPDSCWFTKTLLPVLKSKNAKLAYVMLWRNASNMQNHFYAPFPGHPSVPDFIKFYQDEYTWFENDLKNMYSSKK
jgi:mannan endo-1,4-beta-mannosidase